MGKNKLFLYARNWTMEMNDNRVKLLIKENLIANGYSEDTIVETVMMQNTVNYYAYDTIRYHGIDTKTISIISCDRVKNMIKNKLEENNMEVIKIFPSFGEKVASYIVTYKEVNNKMLVRK